MFELLGFLAVIRCPVNDIAVIIIIIIILLLLSSVDILLLGSFNIEMCKVGCRSCLCSQCRQVLTRQGLSAALLAETANRKGSFSVIT